MTLSNEQILCMSTKDFTIFLHTNYLHSIPVECESLQKMEEISKLLPKLMNTYSYLVSLLADARIKKRLLGNHNRYSIEYKDMIDKTEILYTLCETVKEQRQVLSRMITIRKMIQEELRM